MSLHLRKFLIRTDWNKSVNVLQQLIKKHYSSVTDPTIEIAGKREYVGFGINGSPVYADCLQFPMPAIRFREPNDEIIKLQEKEKHNWNELSINEIKTLYRYSFCQTFAEFLAPTGAWKSHIGIGLLISSLGIYLFILLYITHPDLPESFNEDNRQAQLKRMIALEVNPITGISSKWDYDVGDWK